MRGLRTFLGLVVILVVLGAYLYFVESKRTPGDEGPKKEKVFSVEADKIDEISIKAESGEQTTLRKSGTEWQIVSPTTAKPDSSEVSGLTSNLSGVEIQSVVDENPPDLKEYGLANPRVEVTFRAGGQSHTLQIGQKTPPGSDLYAKRGSEKKVFLIASYLDSTFNRKTFDLRDKAAIQVDRDKVDSLEIVTPERTMRFTKANGEWQMTAPAAGRADFSAVEGLSGRIAGLQMKSLAPETADAKKFGLEKPAASVRIGTGSSQATLVLGSKAEDGVYARDLSRPVVFTIDATLLDDLKKDPFQYRQKDLFDARSFNSTRLEIVRAGQTYGFEKTKSKNKEGQEEEKWRQVSPQARDVDQAKVESLLSAITGAQATAAGTDAAKAALGKPELAIAIKYDEGKKEDRVSFARSGKIGFASRASDPGAVTVDSGTIDAIVKALEDIK
ncbi:MAG: DUF4340 domain-containing protein [Vicinamibacterales bacterium]